MTTRLHAAVVLASLLLTALCGGQERTTPEPVSEIKGVVADESGAVIPQSEVVFNGELGKVVSHRVVLHVDHSPINGGIFDGVPTTVSELPSLISFEPSGYSTCPDLEHAVVRSVGYVRAAETDLHRWAIVKVTPKRTSRPDTVHVQVQVEGERVFCAQAIDGPRNKQKDAVDAAMQWRFKKKRGEFKDDLMGTLTFQF